MRLIGLFAILDEDIASEIAARVAAVPIQDDAAAAWAEGGAFAPAAIRMVDNSNPR